ncbi:MAG TPA: ABC transporter permease [Candidatus Binataceae bacterium]|nr:ABC transporter permease [Candidatus Binataceae bacterium]
MKYFHLLLRNLQRNRRRTILTIISIAVSIFIFCGVLILPVFFALALKSSASSLRLVCHAKAGLSFSMPESYAPKIAAVSHVEGVDSWNGFMGIYHDAKDQFPNVAINPDSVPSVWPDWRVSPDQVAAFQHERIAALAGLDTMKRFNFHLGQQIMLRGTAYPVNLTVKIVGTLGKGTMASMLLLRRDYMQEAVGRTGRVDVFWVMVDRRENLQRVSHAIDETFANSPAPTQTETEGAFQSNILDMFRMIVKLMEAFAVIILVSITLVAANTAAMSIRERRAEVALIRSLGFTSRAVGFLLVAENIVLAVIAGFIGIALAEISVRIAGPRLFGGIGLSWLAPSIVVYATLVALSIGALSALIPAIAIVRRNIVDELRAVG